MLEASVLGLTYHRLLADSVDQALTAPLKAAYDYSFIVSYGAFDDPDYRITEKRAAVLQLHRGLDPILAGLDGKTRQYVRKMEREPGVTIRMGGVDDASYAFYAACERDRGWMPVPRSELEASMVCWGSFAGSPIAGVSAYAHGDRLRLGRIFSTRRSNGVPSLISGAVSRRLVFEFVLHGIRSGSRVLDLGGIDPGDPSKEGVTRFKLSFGVDVEPVRIGRFLSPAFAAREREIALAGLDVT